MIITIMTVAVKLFETGKDADNIIQRVGPLRVTRQLGNLPGRQIRKNRFGQRTTFFSQLFYFIGDIDVCIVTDIVQLIDLRFQFGDGLFKFKKIEIHRKFRRVIIMALRYRFCRA